METAARLKNVSMSAQKVRLIADVIRNKHVDDALQMLKFSRKRAASIVRKVLESAIANAEHNEGADIDELHISEIYINEGPTLKRWRARAKGRGSRILKRMCHVTVKVSDEKAR